MGKKSANTALFQSHLAGKSVCFAGRLGFRYAHDQFVKFLQADGVQVVDDVSDALDYLVLGSTGYATQKKIAEKLNQKKGGSISILDESPFYALLAPTLDEVLALLRAGAKGVERINAFYGDNRYGSHLPSLNGLDLSKADLRGWRMNYYSDILEGVNLREANLTDTML
jgi:hypothetical protein